MALVADEAHHQRAYMCREKRQLSAAAWEHEIIRFYNGMLKDSGFPGQPIAKPAVLRHLLFICPSALDERCDDPED
jgi:hypothetical protein